jgi:transposase
MDEDKTVKDDTSSIIDAEIVDATVEPEVAVESTESDQSATFLNLEELIKNHIESVAKLKEEIKVQREMFDDSFNNNPTYRENDEKVKEATKAKLSVKKQISSQPSVALIAQKLKDLRFDLSETNQTLSELLKDFREQTGATQIETRDGKMMEIVSTMKLVKINSK